MTDHRIQDIWDALVEHGVASEDTLRIVTTGWGYNLETLETVLYVTTGCHNLDQFMDEAGR